MPRARSAPRCDTARRALFRVVSELGVSTSSTRFRPSRRFAHERTRTRKRCCSAVRCLQRLLDGVGALQSCLAGSFQFSKSLHSVAPTWALDRLGRGLGPRRGVVPERTARIVVAVRPLGETFGHEAASCASRIVRRMVRSPRRCRAPRPAGAVRLVLRRTSRGGAPHTVGRLRIGQVRGQNFVTPSCYGRPELARW